MSQSYFQWMRVSYGVVAPAIFEDGTGRNPTFNGCGFHISIKILIELANQDRSQSYFQWMRVSY